MNKPIPFGSPAYREHFRNSKAGRLGGKWYAAANLAVLVAIIVGLLLAIPAWNANFIWLVPAYFLFNNGLEYALHRFPMHRRMRGMEVVYEHVTIHHNFYADEHFYFEEPRDFYAAILPLYIFAGLTAVIALVSGLIYLLAGSSHALFFAANAYGYYLMYELLHFSYHTSETSFAKRRFPFIKFLAKQHILHHQVKMMAHYNFNITFPVFDMICNTWYRKDQKK